MICTEKTVSNAQQDGKVLVVKFKATSENDTFNDTVKAVLELANSDFDSFPETMKSILVGGKNEYLETIGNSHASNGICSVKIKKPGSDSSATLHIANSNPGYISIEVSEEAEEGVPTTIPNSAVEKAKKLVGKDSLATIESCGQITYPSSSLVVEKFGADLLLATDTENGDRALIGTGQDEFTYTEVKPNSDYLKPCCKKHHSDSFGIDEIEYLPEYCYDTMRRVKRMFNNFWNSL